MQDVLIKDLETWLEDADSSRMDLAYYLKLECAQTINRWVERGNIPQRHRQALKRYLKKFNKQKEEKRNGTS